MTLHAPHNVPRTEQEAQTVHAHVSQSPLLPILFGRKRKDEVIAGAVSHKHSQL